MQDFVPQFRNLAFGENTLALRLENASLRESLSDGCAANANRIRCARGARSPSSMKGESTGKKDACDNYNKRLICSS